MAYTQLFHEGTINSTKDVYHIWQQDASIKTFRCINMQFIDKVNAASKQINPKYDMTRSKVREISNNAKDLDDSIVIGFRYGYLQGMKEAEAKLKTKPGRT